MSSPTQTTSPARSERAFARVADRAQSEPNAVAARRKHLGIWNEITWSNLHADVVATSRGLATIGVRPGSTVALLGENSYDWIVADLSLQRVGAILLPVPTQATAEELGRWLAERSVTVALCGDQEYVDRVVAAKSGVTTIVPFDAIGVAAYPGIDVVRFSEVREAGAANASDLADADAASAGVVEISAVEPVDGVGLVEIATSAIAVATAKAVAVLALSPRDRVLAIAPFSDAVTRSTDVYAALISGAQLHLPETLASVPDDMQEVRPTVLAAPRRVFELIRQEARVKQRETGRLRRRLIAWGLSGEHPGTGPRAVFVTRSIAARHGLSRVRLAAVTGDERLATETVAFLRALKVPVVHAWGSAAAGGLALVESDDDALQLSATDRARADAWRGQFASNGASALEAELRENLCVRRAVVYQHAGSADFAAIVELDFEVAALWATDHDVDFGTRASLASNPAVREFVADEVRRVNAQGGNIAGFAIASREFSTAEGELGPTLEVRPDRVRAAFASTVTPIAGDAGIAG